VDRRTSSSIRRRLDRYVPDHPWARMGLVVLVLGLIQAALFYDHFAVALTLLFGLGFGLWLRSWRAAAPALASFLVAYLLAVGTGWLHDARPLWEPLLGGMLAVLGGLIGGGIFDVLRRDFETRAPERVPMDSIGGSAG
jgi:hypothetical protein